MDRATATLNQEQVTRKAIFSEIPLGIRPTYNGKQLVMFWPYLNIDGSVLGYVVRYQGDDGNKDIVPHFEQECGMWLPGSPSGRNPLYGLDVLAERGSKETVLIVEGEKCAAALHQLGFCAVTSLGGSQSASKADWTPLERFKEVVILPDNDDAGLAYAYRVAEALGGLSGGRTSYRCDLPGLGPKGDVVDWIQQRLPGWDGYSPISSFERARLKKELIHTIKTHKAKITLNELECYAWDDPVPLEAATLASWPRVLPAPLQDYADALAESTETPIELSAMTVLGIMAVAAQRPYEVEVGPEHREILSFWTMCVLPSGSRKSQVLAKAQRPLLEVQAAEAERLRPEIARIRSAIETDKRRIQELRKQAAKTGDANEREELKREIACLEAALPTQPTPPQFCANDVTPECMAELVKNNQGCFAIVSDEAGILDTIAGRYNRGIPNLDLCLQGYTGSHVSIQRKGQPSIDIPRPRISFVLTPQDEVVRTLTQKPDFRGRGLLARYLFVVPHSNVGHRTGRTEAIPQQVKAAYEAIIAAILRKTFPGDSEALLTIRLSPAALDTWHEFSQEVEARLRDGGEFEHMRDWACKLPGQVARIAGLFHVARYAGRNPEQYEISQEDMQNAIALGWALSKHALIAFDLMELDKAHAGARRLLDWIFKSGHKEFTKRQAHHDNKYFFKNAKEVGAALELLEENVWIQKVEKQKEGQGRRSEFYEVNPKVYRNN